MKHRDARQRHQGDGEGLEESTERRTRSNSVSDSVMQPLGESLMEQLPIHNSAGGSITARILRPSLCGAIVGSSQSCSACSNRREECSCVGAGNHQGSAASTSSPASISSGVAAEAVRPPAGPTQGLALGLSSIRPQQQEQEQRRQRGEAEAQEKAARAESEEPFRHLLSIPTLASAHSPDEHLDGILRSRGYVVDNRSALRSCYRTAPTSKQVSDYDMEFMRAVKECNVPAVEALADEGRSMNACNRFGESVLHMAARRGSARLFAVMLLRGAHLGICDDYGRTPLHDACWTCEPYFAVVMQILKRDRMLIKVRDARGFTPLNYVKREFWGSWCAFLDTAKDEFWKAGEDADTHNAVLERERLQTEKKDAAEHAEQEQEQQEGGQEEGEEEGEEQEEGEEEQQGQQDEGQQEQQQERLVLQQPPLPQPPPQPPEVKSE